MKTTTVPKAPDLASTVWELIRSVPKIFSSEHAKTDPDKKKIVFKRVKTMQVLWCPDGRKYQLPCRVGKLKFSVP